MQSVNLFGFDHVFVPGTEPETLVLLHGMGGTEHDLLPFAPTIWPGANVLSPRGQIMEGPITRWFERTAPGVFDEDDLRFRVQELAAFLPQAAAEYGVDPAKLWAFGYSNGANMAAAMMLLQPASLAGAAMVRAMLPFERVDPPDAAGKPVYIAAAEQDEMISQTRTKALVEVLRAGGADVTIAWEPTGHKFRTSEIEAIAGWLQSR